MKGVLGLGAASTAFYLQEIHRKFNLKNEEFSTCPLLLYQVDFQEINPFLPNDFLQLVPILKLVIADVKKLAITKILVPNITLHETLDKIDLPFTICHPVKLTISYFKENNLQKAVLFGTNYTMNSSYLKTNFAAGFIELNVPTAEDQLEIDQFRKKVYLKEESTEDIKKYQSLINKYAACAPIIIACTELSMYSAGINGNCIDMAELQIEEFLK